MCIYVVVYVEVHTYMYVKCIHKYITKYDTPRTVIRPVPYVCLNVGRGINRPSSDPSVTCLPAAPPATVRANSTPVSSKAILQKLPLNVYKRLEEVVTRCSYMEWKHFDAGG